MNILHLYQKTTPTVDITLGLMELGHTVKTIDEFLSDSFENETCTSAIAEKFESDNIDAVITFNYYPYVSNICEQYNIPYLAWLFDSPVMYVYTHSIYNKCNHIFSFDKTFYKQIKDLGIEHIYYMPLAANTSRLSSINISDQDFLKYNHQISFVGRFFQDNNYNRFYNTITPEYHNYFNQLFQLQYAKRDMDVINTYISDAAISYIKDILDVDYSKEYPLANEKECFSFLFLARKYTELERLNIFNAISSIFTIDMYTDADTSQLPNVINHGTIDAYEEAPKMFACSKINLNFTQSSIRTGVPLRNFEIMGSGGFLLTNPQEEMSELFVPNEDYITYSSLEEIPDKINYYLTHEKERQEIVFNGFKKIHENYTYPIQLSKILSVI